MKPSKPFEDIDWSKVALPRGTTQADIERAYEAGAEDLAKLNKYFERHFSGKMKKASIQMMTMSIFDVVQTEVFMHPDGVFDVSGLLKYVANDDRQLFADVCTFCYEFFQGKPGSIQVLNRFKGMLTYFLCKVGF